MRFERAVNNLFTPRASSGRTLVEARSAHIAPWRDQSRCPSLGRLSTRSTRSMATFQTRVLRVSAPLGYCDVPPTRFRGGPAEGLRTAPLGRHRRAAARDGGGQSRPVPPSHMVSRALGWCQISCLNRRDHLNRCKCNGRGAPATGRSERRRSPPTAGHIAVHSTRHCVVITSCSAPVMAAPPATDGDHLKLNYVLESAPPGLRFRGAHTEAG